LNGVFITGEVDEGCLIYNYAGAIWNYGGGTYDPRVQLYCNYDANTFNYNGAGQNIITPQDAYWNLILSNSGLKESQANLDINGDLTIEGIAQFDVSTNSNNLNIAGDWVVTSTNGDPLVEGNETVTFDGTIKQTISTVLAGGETFYDLQISNAGTGLELSSTDITITSSLTMNSGNINAGTNTVYLNNAADPNPADLTHSDGHIIGKFRRDINSTYTGQDYIFPVGTSSNENTATFNFATVTTPGSLTVEFKTGNPGGAGVPGVGENVISVYTDGYWDLTPTSLVVGNYDLDLVANGFTSKSFNSSVRILNRDNSGSWLALTGTHVNANDPPPIAHRTGITSGIATPNSQLGLGHTDCIDITTNPVSQTACAGSNITFTVAGSTSDGPLTYQWKKDGVNLAGENGASLVINPVGASDAGAYTCLVGGQSCGSALSTPATLSILEPFSGLGYAYKKTITIVADNVKGTEDLINFPILVNVTDPDLAIEANGGYVQDGSGYDIVFADEQGYKLDHQIEKYVATTGEYIAWVRIPALSHNSDTRIEIIYGNPLISTDPSAASTWSSDYVSVWHLGENANPYLDGTGNSNDGTNNGSSDIAGLIGNAQDFESSGGTGTERIEVGNFNVNSSAITLSAWVKPESLTNPTDARIISKSIGELENEHWWMMSIYSTENFRFRLKTTGTTTTHYPASNNIINTGNWQLLNAVYDGSNIYMYINGIEYYNTTKTGSLAQSSDDVAIGNQPLTGTPDKPFDGILDEVRVLQVARTSDWLRTEYLNQVDPSTFLSFSAQADYSEYDFDFCEYDTITYNVPDLYDTYTWTVGDGGNKLTVDGTNEMTILWNGAGSNDDISLAVKIGPTCSGSSPTYPVTVNAPPGPAITGNDTVCPSATGEVYNTVDEGNNYSWNISNGSITGGGSTYEATVNWGAGPSGQLIIYDTIVATGCGATDTMDVAIGDFEDPVITCSGNVTPGTDPGECFATVAGIGPISNTDNCTAALTVSYRFEGATIGSGVNDASGSQFNTGITTVWYISEDDVGNKDSCSFTVTVTDNENPVVTCIADQSRDTDAGECDRTATGGEFDITLATDNCGVVDTTYQLSGATTTGEISSRTLDGVDFNTGITTVTWNVYDAEGNVFSCSFTVTVTDNENPTTICKDITVYLDTISGLVSITVDSIDNGSFDNCGIADRRIGLSSKSTFTCNDLGSNNVYLVVEDLKGNIDSCLSNVTVEYLVLPNSTATPTDTILCNRNSTEILLNNSFSYMTFKWTVSASSALSGFSEDSVRLPYT
ncbi:hypothetical protein LCGC14_1480180, partial [marine sediment metagenome]